MTNLSDAIVVIAVHVFSAVENDSALCKVYLDCSKDVLRDRNAIEMREQRAI